MKIHYRSKRSLARDRRSAQGLPPGVYEAVTDGIVRMRIADDLHRLSGRSFLGELLKEGHGDP